MQNIQDLKENIFFESKNIISILGKINNVDDLVSKQDLVDELMNRISFLTLLEKNVKYYKKENTRFSEKIGDSLINQSADFQDFSHEVTEEEAIFNNELNEIGEDQSTFSNEIKEEGIFNNQLNEIVENEYHESLINSAEEEKDSEETEIVENNSEKEVSKEDVFTDQLDEIDDYESSETEKDVLSFVDEERILENSEPENNQNSEEEIFNEEVTEEEAIFNNQLNDIEEDDQSSEENNQENFDEEKEIYEDSEEKIPSIFDGENLEDELLIEENEYISEDFKYEDEIVTENSNVENILPEIKKDIENPEEDLLNDEDSERRKIVEIDKPLSEKENPASDQSFENLDAYQQEKKIRLANIKGLKSIQTLFDDDPLEREVPQQKPEPIAKEDGGSLLKTNIPTNYMEAEKQKPEFKLDLNDRMAFTKLLFGGSQTDLNNAVSELNRCRNLEEAKEYLSELYYDRKWNKVDEYAQRLWILVENKFL